MIIGNRIAHTRWFILCIRSLNYCCVEYYYARATHALRMSYEVVTIVVRKNYITLQLRYETIRNLFFDSYRSVLGCMSSLLVIIQPSTKNNKNCG